MARSKKSDETPAPEATPEATQAPAEEQEPVTITGRLGADPVLRHTQSGKPVTNLSVAVNAAEGETTWHRVVVWGRTAETVVQYKRKGHVVEVTGRPRTRTWIDGDENPREIVEINAFRVQFVSRQASAPDAEREVA